MTRTSFLVATGSACAAAVVPLAAPAAESDIAVHTPTGTLAGTLTVPSGAPGAVPIVLIVAGSGPTDRNGNNGPAQGNTYLLLAQALASRGIAAVRYDKRGVGASAAALVSESDSRFDTYVDDVAAWQRLLRTDARFSRLIVAGHSEGSLLGMIAVQRAPADAYVSLEGAGRPAPVVLREQLQPKLPPDLYAQADTTLTQLQAGHTVADPPPQLAMLFRPSVQPYLISWFAYDPAAEIAKVRIPATIVQGTADIQVSMVDAHALAAAEPAAKLVVVEDMNHVLKYAPDTSTQQALLAGYSDPSLPIEPHVVDAISALT
jgi:pimeloyl-ACP methyl ester carboxylesterase